MSDRTPVVVGVGQAVHRPLGTSDPPDPVALMVQATAAALTDAGRRPRDVTDIDQVSAVDLTSWRYAGGVAREVARRLGVPTAEVQDTPVGGEQPIAELDRLATAVHGGTLEVALLVGGESQASLDSTRRAGERVPWPEKPPRPVDRGVERIVHPEAWRHGLRAPIQIYPLFENARRAAMGTCLAHEQARTAALWSQLSRVAADNPFAWDRVERSAAEIATPDGHNRWICHPYTRLMTASPSVDQAAAILVTTRGTALAWGIAESRLVYPWSAAGAVEVRDPLARPTYATSDAMAASLRHVVARSGLAVEDLLLELYSCFPVVPKLAASILDLDLDARSATVAGGLTFFGGPGSAYMLHAVASMVERIRSTRGSGLLYGQGEFVTKHHAMTLGPTPPPVPYPEASGPVPEQAAITAATGPPVTARPDGPATVETCTTAFPWPADGPGTGIVVGRLDATGERFVAVTRDERAWDIITGAVRQPVGLPLHVRSDGPHNVVTFA